MKACVVIPCFNHGPTVAGVVQAAQAFCSVIVVDDGSTVPLPEIQACTLLQLEGNQGKAAALRAGFRCAIELGFTHAITMDADGQHFAEDLPKFLLIAATQPETLAVGVRDFLAAGCPTHRRRSNAVSTFWYRVETGVRLADTQCGFRCYPLALVRRLKVQSSRYAYELEFMVRAAWVGTLIQAVPVKCTYAQSASQASNFRPVKDLLHITIMNIGLVLQSWCVPRSLRVAWSCGEQTGFRCVLKKLFSEHAQDPLRLSLAVGIGLFFGIVPIWGCQMIAAGAVAHFFRLNKATALLTSNISIPPMMPIILYGGLSLGHWMFTGQRLDFALDQMTKAKAFEYLWHWSVGSVTLGAITAVLGTGLTYVAATLAWKK